MAGGHLFVFGGSDLPHVFGSQLDEDDRMIGWAPVKSLGKP